MGFRYLTFDCYGTLIDWKTGIEREITAAIGPARLNGKELLDAYVDQEKGQESSYRKYRDVLRDTFMSLSSALGAKASEDAARGFAASVPRWPPFPDTTDFLREVGARGYKRFILSNVDNDLLEETIERNRLEVDGFVTAEEVGSYKPLPGHWLRFMQKTGAGKADILHVAQSFYHDVIPTRALGIASAWINRYREPMPLGADPLYVSDSLRHLAEILEGDPSKA